MTVPADPSECFVAPCPRCSGPREPAWRFCPMCGEPLAPDAGLKLPDLATLLRLRDRELRELLRRLERADLLAALGDPAWAPLKAKVQPNLPQAAVRDLEDEWAYRPFDPEAAAAAQGTIRRVAAELDEAGCLTLKWDDGRVWLTPANVAGYRDAGLEAAVAGLDPAEIMRLLETVDQRTLALVLFACAGATRRVFYDQMTERTERVFEEELRETLEEVELGHLRAAQMELRERVQLLRM